jgi:hypothetical protein
VDGIGRYSEFAFVFGNDSMLAHQTGHTVSTAGITVAIQLSMNAGTAVCFSALLMGHFDFHQQAPVLLTAEALTTVQPGIEPASAHFQCPAHQTHWKRFPMVPYERISHRESFEKIAAAFFNISRSMRRTSFSRFRRRNSASSELIRPLPGNGSILPCAYFSVKPGDGIFFDGLIDRMGNRRSESDRKDKTVQRDDYYLFMHGAVDRFIP